MKNKDEPAIRIDNLKKEILEIVEDKNIDYVVLEDTFLTVVAGKPRGVVMYALLNRNIGVLENAMIEIGMPYSIVYPKVWKATLKIKGRARAEQKANTMLKVYEVFNKKVSEDEADAIGIGMWACVNKPWETSE